MKKSIHTIGIDDAAFIRNKSSSVFAFGVIMRGNQIVEGVLRTNITVDGLDATNKIISMIKSSKFFPILRLIFLSSSTIAGFNIIELKKMYDELLIPIIVVIPTKPDENKVNAALSKLLDMHIHEKLLNSNPPLEKLSFFNRMGKQCSTFIQKQGIDTLEEVKVILKLCTNFSCIPESLRIAHIIGKSFRDFII